MTLPYFNNGNNYTVLVLNGPGFDKKHTVRKMQSGINGWDGISYINRFVVD